ncbi:MAG: YoaK family protein [Acutalibacter sp.]
MNEKSEKNEKKYLVCERRSVFALLTLSAGMMGAYTFNLRGGVFCNAQTANVVLMALSFGQGNWSGGAYYLIPITAYLAGAFLSEILPSPLRRFGFLRWDTYLVAFEVITLFLIGFIPLSWPHHLVQVLVNFIASMQYNTFRQAEGIPMATTFCTNQLRQVGIGFAKAVRKGDRDGLARALFFLGMLGCFFSGGVLSTVFCRLISAKAIWLNLIPLGIVLTRLVHADLTDEKELLFRKPMGH